jgi:C-terminal processing protease CtpA/Prc
MNKTAISLCILLLLFSCKKAIDIKKFNEGLIQIVKTNSLYSDSINWISLEKELDSLSNRTQTIDKCSLSVACVIDKLRKSGDFHTCYIPKMETGKMVEQNLNITQPTAKNLGDNIAYLQIPGFNSLNNNVCNDFAQKIQNYIRALDSDSNIGWVVDLRENTGGNMYPMIAGLGPLLGNGILGYFIDKRENKTAWFYQDGIATTEGSKSIIKIAKFYTIKNKTARIAVIIGNKTASSGEMTTISFIGKSNVKLFGQSSGGYLTGNRPFALLDGSCIALAGCYVTDRTLKKYTNFIVPDIITYDFANTDNSLKEAVKWLKKGSQH